MSKVRARYKSSLPRFHASHYDSSLFVLIPYYTADYYFNRISTTGLNVKTIIGLGRLPIHQIEPHCYTPEEESDSLLGYKGTTATTGIRKMSVRVVGRVRPLLKSERELDVIVRTSSSNPTAKSGSISLSSKDDKKGSQGKAALRDRDTVVRIPNPKNESEEYAFQFNAVYDANVTQQELFDAEGSYYNLI